MKAYIDATQAAAQEANKKREAMQAAIETVCRGLEELGVDAMDASMNGCDTVDFMCKMYPILKAVLP